MIRCRRRRSRPPPDTMDEGSAKTVKTFAEYEALAEQTHGHLCAGQILGLRMALCGLRHLEIEDPADGDRKRLITFVEIDRCVTDAIAVVTGCRLGKRALKFRDFGKVAATFCDLLTSRAIRVSARESSRAAALHLHPEIEDVKRRQLLAYREMEESELFSIAWVSVSFEPQDLPGYKAPRAVCASCGEHVNFRREVERGGRTLCRSCAGESYYTLL
jgi:formylmethanofuran dehydrogenase subunit E